MLAEQRTPLLEPRRPHSQGLLTSQQFHGPPELPPHVPQDRLVTWFTQLVSHPVLSFCGEAH